MQTPTTTTQTPTDPPVDREYVETLYKVFDKFALDDQRNFYEHTVIKFRRAGNQVNVMRAICSLLTGIVSGGASLIVQANFVGSANCTIGTNSSPHCAGLQVLVYILLALAIIIPALGGALNTLADLFQWDKLVNVYSAALASIEVAAASAPVPEMDDTMYQASLQKFVVGTLGVMHDESAQWGQLIRTPEQVQKFLEGAEVKAIQAAALPNFKAADSASTPAVGEPGTANTDAAGTDSHVAG